MHDLEHVARGPLATRAPEELLVGAAAMLAAILALRTAAVAWLVLPMAVVVLGRHGVARRTALRWLAAPAVMLAIGLGPDLVACRAGVASCGVDRTRLGPVHDAAARGLACAAVGAMLAATLRLGALLGALRRRAVPAVVVDLLGDAWSLAIAGRHEVRALRTAARLRQGESGLAAEWRTVQRLLPLVATRVLRRAERRAAFAALRGGGLALPPHGLPVPTAPGLLLACVPGLVVWGLGR